MWLAWSVSWHLCGFPGTHILPRVLMQWHMEEASLKEPGGDYDEDIDRGV